MDRISCRGANNRRGTLIRMHYSCGVWHCFGPRAATNLKKKKLIEYKRGHVTILDRAGLESHSCECYGVTKREFDRLLGAPSGIETGQQLAR